MKTHHPLSKMFAGLAAVALTFVGAVATVNAASIALNGQVEPASSHPELKSQCMG